MKTFEESLQPDPRFRAFMAYDEYDQLRRMEFRDHYAMVANLDLPMGVTRTVATNWERALHCLVYAWFDYELLIVGEGQAFAAADLALKEKLAYPPGKGPLGFAGRLKAAVERGLVMPSTATNGWLTTHEILGALRNEIAHGTEHVHDPNMASRVFDHLRALICELYGLPIPAL